MPDLDFQIESAEVTPYAAAPQVALKLRITNSDPERRFIPWRFAHRFKLK